MRRSTFRLVGGGEQYALKSVGLEPGGLTMIVRKGLRLEEAREVIERARRSRQPGDETVTGIVWLGPVWEDSFSEVKL